MPDIGYAVGTEDANGNFVEHGRFNNKTSSVADPVLLEHADSGNTAELGSDRLEVTGADLRLDTGQSIEDGSGTRRLTFSSTTTRLRGDSGDVRIDALQTSTQINDQNGRLFFGANAGAFGGSSAFIGAYNNAPITFVDKEGGFDAVQYDTDSTQGTLSLPNADLDMSGSLITGNSGDLSLSGGGSNERIVARLNQGTSTDAFVVNDAVNGNDSIVMERTGLVDIRKGSLRLANGQAIEDGSGTERMALDSNSTKVISDGERNGLIVSDGSFTRLNAFLNQSLQIQDKGGNFTAVNYFASSSAPGTLSLDNAVLNFTAGQSSTTGDSMTANPESDTEDGFIEVDIGGTRFQIPAYSP